MTLWCKATANPELPELVRKRARYGSLKRAGRDHAGDDHEAASNSWLEGTTNIDAVRAGPSPAR